jgi:hypothetical protein
MKTSNKKSSTNSKAHAKKTPSPKTTTSNESHPHKTNTQPATPDPNPLTKTSKNSLRKVKSSAQ